MRAQGTPFPEKTLKNYELSDNEGNAGIMRWSLGLSFFEVLLTRAETARALINKALSSIKNLFLKRPTEYSLHQIVCSNFN